MREESQMGEEIQLRLQQIDTLLDNLIRDLDAITARALTARYKVQAAMTRPADAKPTAEAHPPGARIQSK